MQATYPGADALTVEGAVAAPIEQQTNGVDNMLYVKSTNASDGTFTMRVDFRVGTNIDTDNVLVQNRVTQATPLLPSDVQALGLTVQKSVSSPLLVFSLYSPNGTFDQDFLSNYATININDALLRVTGLGQVSAFGAANYAMRVWVLPDKLQTLGLTFGDLRTAILQQSTANPGGQVGAEPAPEGQEFTYTIRAQGRLITPQEFGDIVVRENPDGSVVRLKDVARIDLGTQTYTQVASFDGKPAAVIAVYQIPGSNALAVADGAKKNDGGAEEAVPRGHGIRVSLDTTLPITAGVRDILRTLLEAFVLVVVVVYLFLQTWRATLIPILTVPVSLVGVFAFFPVLGFSINTLSLFGLVLAIGFVVDDAIVVVEAVERHIEEGMTARDATNKAMDEVSGPVVAIALSMSAVFIPVALIPGITGRLYQQFALTIAGSVLISAFMALSLSPALCAMLLRPRRPTRGLLARFFGGLQSRVRSHPRRLRARRAPSSRERSLVVLGLLVVMGAATVLLGGRLPAGFVPDRGPGIPLRQRPAARRGVAAADRGRVQGHRGHPGDDAGRRPLRRDRRLQPALAVIQHVQRALLRVRSSRGRSARRRRRARTASRSLSTSASTGSPRGPCSPSGRRPSRASAPPAASISCSQDRSGTRDPERARRPGRPLHRGGQEAPRDRADRDDVPRRRFRRSSPRSTATRSSSKASRSATCTRRSRHSWAARTSTSSIASVAPGGCTWRRRPSTASAPGEINDFWVRAQRTGAARWCPSRRS